MIRLFILVFFLASCVSTKGTRSPSHTNGKYWTCSLEYAQTTNCYLEQSFNVGINKTKQVDFDDLYCQFTYNVEEALNHSRRAITCYSKETNILNSGAVVITRESQCTILYIIRSQKYALLSLCWDN